MGCKMIAAITWTQLELKGLLEDEESHVHFERAKRHLGLHPFHLTDLNAALREILSATVNSYDPKLQGIILSYRNPKLLSRMGAVLYDTCYIHIDIEADFYVFRPNVGDTLKGIVNKKSKDHVGILVHKTFNATIPRPDDDENWPGHSIHIGQEVRFTVTCLDFKDRLPYIRGSLDAEDYLRGCRTFDETFMGKKIVDVKPNKSKFSYNEDGDLDDSNIYNEASVDAVEEEVPRKKAKKLKLEDSKDEIRVKTKKKPKVEVEAVISEDETDSNKIDQSHVKNDDNITKEVFLPGKLKLKRENVEDRVETDKKKKKRRIKNEGILSDSKDDVHETSQRHSEEVSISEEEFVPRKSKKLKIENSEEKITVENKRKTKVGVKVLHSHTDSDAHIANGNRIEESEYGVEKSRKRCKIKTEVFSSETDSDANKAKKTKRMKIESANEKSSKKETIKAEIPSSETDSGINDMKQNVRTKHELKDDKIKKKHRIKAEVLTPETYD